MNAEMNVGRNSERNEFAMNMNFTDEQKREMGIAESCNASKLSLFTVAGGILFFVGAVIYSLIAM